MENTKTTYSFDELSKESQRKALNRYKYHLVENEKWYAHCDDEWYKRGVYFEFLKSIKGISDHHDPSDTRFRMFNVYIDANTSLENVAITIKKDFSKKSDIYQKANDYLKCMYDWNDTPKYNFIKEIFMTEIYKSILEQLHSEWNYLCSDESLMNTFEHDEWVFNSVGNRLENKIYHIETKVFLDWYFFNNDTENLVHGIVDDIFEKGKASITVQEIFNNCDSVPISLVLDNLSEEDEEYGSHLKPNKDIFLKVK